MFEIQARLNLEKQNVTSERMAGVRIREWPNILFTRFTEPWALYISSKGGNLWIIFSMRYTGLSAHIFEKHYLVVELFYQQVACVHSYDPSFNYKALQRRFSSKSSFHPFHLPHPSTCTQTHTHSHSYTYSSTNCSI